MGKLREVLDRHLVEEDFGIDTLCQELTMSPRQLQRKIRAVTDESPTDLIRSARLAYAKYLLEQHSGTVSEYSLFSRFQKPLLFLPLLLGTLWRFSLRIWKTF